MKTRDPNAFVITDDEVRLILKKKKEDQILFHKAIEDRKAKREQYRTLTKMCNELERRVKQVKPLQKRPYPDEVKAREKFLQKVRDHP